MRNAKRLVDQANDLRRRAEILQGASPHLFAAAMLGFITIPQAEEAMSRSAHPFIFPMGLFIDSDTGRISNDIGPVLSPPKRKAS